LSIGLWVGGTHSPRRRNGHFGTIPQFLNFFIDNGCRNCYFYLEIIFFFAPGTATFLHEAIDTDHEGESVEASEQHPIIHDCRIKPFVGNP
jgi:hypothetical protein